MDSYLIILFPITVIFGIDPIHSLRIKRRPEALGHQKLSRASKFSFRASKFFFFFMFKNL